MEGNAPVHLDGNGRDWCNGGRLSELFIELSTISLATSIHSFIINRNKCNFE